MRALAVSLVAGVCALAPTPSPAPPAGDTYAVGDRVWLDRNRDGIQDVREPGVRDVRVRLTDPAGRPATHVDGSAVDPVTTDLDGAYFFDYLAPGDYRVVFEALPDGYGFSVQNAGADPEMDSDADTSTGATSTFTLGPVGPMLPQMQPLSPGGSMRAVAIDPSIDAGLRR